MTPSEITITTIVPVGLALAGIVVLWLAAGQRRTPLRGAFPLMFALRLIGGVLFVGGILLGVISTTWMCAVITVPVVGLVLVAAVRRYYDAEQQSLVWMLVAAAERGIPLDQAARAFSEERNDIPGNRAAQLADYLEAGVPLGLALRRSGHRVDAATSLAADLGYQTGALGAALRKLVECTDAVETVTLPMAGRMIYLGVVVVQTLLVQTFVTMRIIPVMDRMGHDFGFQIPRLATKLATITALDSEASFVWLAAAAAGVLALILGALWLMGFSPRRVPLVRRLWWRLDSSLVMQWLASGVRQHRPVLEILRLLASYFPQVSMRRRLERSARRVEQGGQWCDSLLRAGVIGRSDSAVLQAAERAGNLPWALDEMADSAVRRWTYRFQVWMSFAFPLVLIALSCGVLAVILSVFLPLVSLIQYLS